MNAVESEQRQFSDVDKLLAKLDSSLLLSDASPTNGHEKSKSEPKQSTSANAYLKKLHVIKSSIFENDITRFKNVLKDMESPNDVLFNVAKSQSSQIRLIIADLMHDCISMKDRESFLAGLADVFDVNEQNKLGFIPLHLAVARGKMKIAYILVRHGSKIDLQNDDGRSPLHIAVLKGHVEVVNFLLSRGANPNLQDRELWTPLHWACRQHNLIIVRCLLTHGARLDMATDRKRYPLDMACGANCNLSDLVWHPMTVWHLIVHGASHISPDIARLWLQKFLPQVELSEEYSLVLSQLLVLMYKAGLLSSAWVETQGIACHFIRQEQINEARYWCVRPARLSQMCRLRVRSLLLEGTGGRSIADSASRLPLPKSLLHFVLLKK